MGLNKNHEVEEFNGIRCAIVEKGISKERVDYLKKILEFNNYKVEVMAAPPPKTAAVPAVTAANSTEEPNQQKDLVTPQTNDSVPVLYNIGVTDLMFNPTNAIFGRLLKTHGGHIVTLAYWNQKTADSNDELPYYSKQ